MRRRRSANQFITTTIEDVRVFVGESDHQEAIALGRDGIADAGVRPQIVDAVEQHDRRVGFERRSRVHSNRHQLRLIPVVERSAISRPVWLLSAVG